MGKTLQYVKEFDFGGTDKAAGGKCATPKAKYASGGKVGAPKSGKPVVEKATGERYPSRKAMIRHEAEETPRMRREELVERPSVRARRSVPVASRDPMIPMKTGGIAAKVSPKVGKVMSEYKSGDLHSGKNGPVVKNPKQAIAIAMSESRRAPKKP